MAGFISSIKVNFIDNVSAGVKNVRAKFADMGKALGNVGNGSGLVSVAADLSLVAGQVDRFAASIKGAIAAPGELAASVESAMARASTVIGASNAIAGDVPATLGAIKAAASNMAAGIGPATLGMAEFTNSTFSLISSGLSAEQAIAGVSQATLLAQAAGDEASVAVSTLAGVYNNFGNKVGKPKAEMERLSDVIARTQQFFAFENLKQFSDGLSNVAGAAIGFKVPFEQSAAIIGQLNSNMIVGANAGTAMKSILGQMTNASKRLGFEVANTADGGVDLVATLENIAKAGVSGAALTAAFGTEAGPAVGILTENLSALQDGYDAVLSSAGTTLVGAGKMTDTLAARQERLTNASQVFSERIGVGANTVADWGVKAKLAGVSVLNWATGLPGIGDKVAGLTGGVLSLGGSFVGAASGALSMTSGLASSFIMLEKAGPMFKMLKSGLGVFASGAGSAIKIVFGLGKSAIFAVPKLFALAAAHWAVLGPILLIVGGIALLAAGVVAVIKNWGAISGFFVRLWDGIKNAFSAAIDFIKNIFKSGLDWIAGKLAKIPLIGRLFDTKENNPANMAETVAGGTEKALPAAERAGFQVAQTFDQYMPHSNAKKGPLSRLTESGAALVETLGQGARRRRLNLSEPLKLPAATRLKGMPQTVTEPQSTTYSIRIDNLTVQADDAEDIFRFVRMLQTGAGIVA